MKGMSLKALVFMLPMFRFISKKGDFLSQHEMKKRENTLDECYKNLNHMTI